MAMIDYGAIVFKNGKLMTHDMFTPMKEAVGWEDIGRIDLDYHGEPLKLKDNYFAYIGDEENTIGFYKNSIVYVDKYDGEYYKHREFFANSYTWLRWSLYFGGSHIIVTHRNGYYVLRWKYKGDKYKVYFGNGVDIGSYEKWHIVNYYRSIPHYFRKLMVHIRRKKYYE